MKRKNIFMSILGLIICAGIIYTCQTKPQLVADIGMQFIKEYQQNMLDTYAEPFIDAVLTAFPK